MISFLRGAPIHEEQDSIVLDVQGVGYELQCSRPTLDDFFGQTEIKAWVYTHVREDAITLFGFSSALEKKIFSSLIKVNGIGPKMAIVILSGTSVSHLSEMIEAGDVKALTKLPKVGKKTAEQMILTLKGKLEVSSTSSLGGVSTVTSNSRQEIVSALTNLGFKGSDVEKVVDELPVDIGFEAGLRDGLAALTNPQAGEKQL